MYKIGWFSSGRDKAAFDLLLAVHKAIENNYIKNARIRYLFINREYGESSKSDALFELASKLGIEVICLSSKKFKTDQRLKGLEHSIKLGYDSEELKKWRKNYDREIINRLNKKESDLNVLAGYMLIFSNFMVQHHVFINLHPALPGGPQGTWQKVIWTLIKVKAEKAGCMIHLVTEELDRGPPITYCTFSIRGGKFDALWNDLEHQLQSTPFDTIMKKEYETHPLFQAIREEEAVREAPLLIETIRLFSKKKLLIKNKDVFMDCEKIEGGLSLTEPVERYLKVTS